MKTKTKALVLSLCAVLLVAVSVFTTIAYLQSSEKVTNTFTVGKVKITLDEAKVDQYGVEVEDAGRVRENAYKLIPGHTYVKDPTVHFEAGSEASYLFVKVENDLAAIEDDTKIADQITANNKWSALEGVDGVYYKSVPANDTNAAKDYVVFNTFKLKTDANVEGYGSKTITVTAYAIQADGFDTATAAWEAVTKVTE